MPPSLRVAVWNEFYHEKANPQEVRQTVLNAVHWVPPTVCIPEACPMAESLEPQPEV